MGGFCPAWSNVATWGATQAYRFAELVFPLLPLALREKLSQPQLTGPFGEIVANTEVPQAAAGAH